MMLKWIIWKKRQPLLQVLAAILMTVLLTSFYPAHSANAEEEKRRIHVVFDDSGSMGEDYRWYRAVYALEVFASMLGEEDEMKVYPLDSGVKTLEINGKDENRVEKIHQWARKHTGGSTPFEPVISAANELISTKGIYAERWLVILTDGAFSNKKGIENNISEWYSNGLKTIYLAIGRGARSIRSDTGKDFFSYSASSSNAILKNVRDIANRIFQRLILPSSHISQKGDIYTLNVDVPTSSIIVFAQGENVKIGDLYANGAKQQASEIVKVVSQSKNNNFGDPDASLKGAVSIYKTSKTRPFSATIYTIDVSGAREVEFYYDPAVEVDCKLTQGVTVISKGSEIYEGTYTVSGSFIDPLTNQEIHSDLLDEKTIKIYIVNNQENPLTFGEKGGKVNLKEGTATITATAELKTTTLGPVTKDYRISAQANKIVPDQSNESNAQSENFRFSIRQDQLKNNKSIEYIVQIVDSKTQQPVNEERWKNSNLEIPDQYGIKWKWNKDGLTAPYVRLIPSAAGKYSDVLIGDLDIICYTLSGNDPNTRTESIFPLTVEPYLPIQIEKITVQINQKEIKDHSVSFTLHIQDPYNNNSPAAGQLWNYIKDVTITDGRGIKWDCQRGPGEGEYTLTPAAADGQLRSVQPGMLEFTVTGIYDDGDMTNWTASETLTLEVIEYPPKQLEIEIEVPAESYPQSRYHMKKSPPVIVTARYQGQVIPNSVWNQADETRDISIVLTDPDQTIDFTISKGTKPGTWEIRPLPHNNKGYQTSEGSIRFTVSIDIQDGDDLYIGTQDERLAVKRELLWTVLEWTVDNLSWIIPTLLFLFWLVAYVFPKKKHLKTGAYGIRFSVEGSDDTTTRPIRKKRGSVLCPFKPQRAVILCECSDYNCTFPNFTIESAGLNRRGTSFRILTGALTGVNLSNYRIGGQTFKSLDELSNAIFQLAGFSIVSEQEEDKGTALFVK